MSAYEAALEKLKEDFSLSKEMIVSGNVVEITTQGVKRLSALILDACKVFVEGYILWESGKQAALEIGDDVEWYNSQEIFLVELATIYGKILSLLSEHGIKFPNFLVLMLDSTIGHHPAWLDSVGVAPLVAIVAIGAGAVVALEVITYIVELIAEYYSSAAYNKDLIAAAQYMTPQQADQTLAKYKVKEFKIDLLEQAKSAVTSIGSVLPLVAIGAAAFFFFRR